MQYTAPDYASLVKLLTVLKRLPDAMGETILTPEEVARISTLGFQAAPGRWQVPPLPLHLTRGNPLLEPLSIGWVDPPTLPTTPNKSDSVLTHERDVGKERAMPRPSRKCVKEGHRATKPVSQPLEAIEEALVQELVSKMNEKAAQLVKPIRKRRWQQLYWRYPAKVFNRAFQILIGQRLILIESR